MSFGIIASAMERWGSSTEETNPQSANSSGTYAGQTCVIRAISKVRVTAVKWDGPRQTDTYRITIAGVVHGDYSLTDGEYPEFGGLEIVLEADETFTFSAAPVTPANRQYGYRGGGSNQYTTHFHFQYWQEAGGGETVPLGIVFDPWL